MKLSVYGEPGYRYARGSRWRVLMDGRPLEDVIRVDTCTGVAWVYDRNPDGSLKIDRKRHEIVQRRVLGSLRVERIADGQHALRSWN